MKAAYNSYGSNYSLSFALKSLLQLIPGRADMSQQLASKLSAYFGGGEVILTHKGRDAIELALRLEGIGARELVFTQAFTCQALEAAITRAGAITTYVDVESESLNLSISTLTAATKQYGAPRAVIVQHSLGTPADIQAIRKWCDQHDCLLIEDLAQAFGGVDDKNTLLGTHADYIVCSFGRDKVLDTVTGGALICKTSAKHLEDQKRVIGPLFITSKSPLSIPKALIFPLLMRVINLTSPLLVGKVLYKVAKASSLIPSPLKVESNSIQAFDSRLAPLVLERINSLEKQLAHRRNIAKQYYQLLQKYVPKQISFDDMQRGSCLRFPIFVSSPEHLSAALKQYRMYFSDRWYRSAVDCGSLDTKTIYEQGSCKSAEYASRHVYNLPTHMDISLEQSRDIARKVLAHAV